MIRATDLKKTLWKNGAGLSSQVLAHPRGSDVSDFQWRVSVAEIRASSEFSKFVGCDRALVLISDETLILNGNNLFPLEVVRFPGEVLVRAELQGSYARDFGVIWKRDLFTINVSVIRAGDGAKLERALDREAKSATRLFHFACGSGECGELKLITGDTLVAEPSALAGRLNLSAGAAVVLVRINPR